MNSPPKTSRKSSAKTLQQLFQILLYAVLIITTIISVSIPFLWAYPFELLSNFRVYYLLVAGGLVFASLIGKYKRIHATLPCWLSLGLFVFNSAWIIPWYLPQAPQRAAGERLRVLTFNINTQNDQWQAIAQAVQTLKPDIATIIETSSQATQELSQRLTTLPFVYRTSGGGITVFSRFPLLSPTSQKFSSGTVLVTSLKVNQKVIKLIAAHPIVPIKARLFSRRNALLAELTTYLQQQPEPLIFLGDLNLTPWSPFYSRLVNKTGLHNTRLGFGIEPSWIEPATHVHYPNGITALIKIPIDHIFVSRNFRVVNCRTKPAANSDHRMLWSDLVLLMGD
jgi:endonuclease/exonuclease/phosphatase (EEP) superfamily protein YafD